MNKSNDTSVIGSVKLFMNNMIDSEHTFVRLLRSDVAAFETQTISKIFTTQYL